MRQRFRRSISCPASPVVGIDSLSLPKSAHGIKSQRLTLPSSATHDQAVAKGATKAYEIGSRSND